MKKLTTADGWECVPQLKRVTRLIQDELGHHFYEINNCVRTQSVEDMVLELNRVLREALSELDTIDTTVEYETVDED